MTICRSSASSEHDIAKMFSDTSEFAHRLILILEGEMSRSQLMEIFVLKNRPHFSVNYPDPALSDDLIEMTLPDKPKRKRD